MKSNYNLDDKLRIQLDRARLAWSKFTLLDKVFFWIMVSFMLIAFAVFVEYGSFLFTLSMMAMFAAIIIFVWALFKILRNRTLMRNMMLYSIAIFFVATGVGAVTEPQRYRDETNARVAQEEALQKQEDAAKSEQDELESNIADETEVETSAGDTDSGARSDDAENEEVNSSTDEQSGESSTASSELTQNDALAENGVTELSQAGSQIRVKGFAPEGSTFALRLANDEVYEFQAASNGSFDVKLPQDVTPYGKMRLQSVSGFWIFKSYENLHDEYFYSMFSGEDNIRSSRYEPVITKVMDGYSGDDLEGFYLPNEKILVKVNSDVLAKTETDDNGYFRFDNVKTSKNYEEIALKAYTSSWFGMNVVEGSLLAKRYLNITENKTFADLPLIKKTEIKTEDIAFKKVTKNDSSLEKGKTDVTRAGKNGLKKTVYEVTYRGDEKVSSKQISAEVDVKPVDQITNIGTYVKPVAPKPPTVQQYSQPSPNVSAGGTVKMSNSDICHAPGTTYYDRTKNFTPYATLDGCLGAGGRLPKR